MKLHKLTCPNCNGMLDMEVADKTKSIFCPYCGQKFLIDDEKIEYTINQNININKHVYTKSEHTRRTVNEADVINAKANAIEKKGMAIFTVLVFVLVGILLFVSFGMLHYEEFKTNREAEEAKQSGKIQAGSVEDYLGENYDAVAAQFEMLGFEHIQTVDLNDTGLRLWKDGDVKGISIAGNSDFDNYDYFNKTDTVIISYH